MRHHQRYFSVLKPDGSLAPEFVAVTNTDGDPDGLIRQGNERVLRARFNDARFFWQWTNRRSLPIASTIWRRSRSRQSSAAITTRPTCRGSGACN